MTIVLHCIIWYCNDIVLSIALSGLPPHQISEVEYLLLTFTSACSAASSGLEWPQAWHGVVWHGMGTIHCTSQALSWVWGGLYWVVWFLHGLDGQYYPYNRCLYGVERGGMVLRGCLFGIYYGCGTSVVLCRIITACSSIVYV